ncbi:MAG: hypothetical protein BGO78_02765 [Chloroflexi bacterium 44-23]|nr:MAG: hypothetical protein BGO78_02765 [Chloroflexi bacterium 44-23]
MYRRRYYRILVFFARTFLNIIWWDIILSRLGFRKIARHTRPGRMVAFAKDFRKLAVRMGGVMIKVGQFLSARLDVLPREITDELAGLQDEVAPEPFEPIRALIEAEFGMPLDKKFSEFNLEPMAAASIGQAYCAKLCMTETEQGTCPDVVVKVQRPHIEDIIEIDLSAIRIVGKWLEQYKPISKRADVSKLIAEFSRSLYEEIDYINEGKNAEKFAENFKDRADVRVPDVIWSHTTRRVLTLQDVGGIKITEYEKIDAAGIDRAEVAERLLDTYLKQIFEDSFFHADPHPGNLFVQPAREGEDPANWRLTFVDFGMTGTIPETTFKGLREMLIAIGTQNSHRLTQSFETLDVLLPGTDIELLEKAGQRIFERFWGKSTEQIREMGHEEAKEFINEFGDLMYEMPFQAPENLILLARCVGILSGMCSALDPQFNIWQSVTPYVAKLVETESGGAFKTILDEVLNVLKVLVALPVKADALVTRMEQGRLEVRMPLLTREMERIHKSQRKIAGSIIFAAFLLGGVQLFISGNLSLAGGFWGVALISFLWVLFVR